MFRRLDFRASEASRAQKAAANNSGSGPTCTYDRILMSQSTRPGTGPHYHDSIHYANNIYISFTTTAPSPRGRPHRSPSTPITADIIITPLFMAFLYRVIICVKRSYCGSRRNPSLIASLLVRSLPQCYYIRSSCLAHVGPVRDCCGHVVDPPIVVRLESGTVYIDSNATVLVVYTGSLPVFVLYINVLWKRTSFMNAYGGLHQSVHTSTGISRYARTANNAVHDKIFTVCSGQLMPKHSRAATIVQHRAGRPDARAGRAGPGARGHTRVDVGLMGVPEVSVLVYSAPYKKVARAPVMRVSPLSALLSGLRNTRVRFSPRKRDE
ncbi:hypothetical protein EVAR_59660_1 [Eumeta japonica]|uniref:Uncharacterized protein n=1 Tax=Eumeta variegata TaxID=151549 RepID=A0A4C1YZ19_EUMVA|nr:hypothetical protein EVAR_59660_1 [Eumeta japonica]